MNGRNVPNLEDRVDAHIPENRWLTIDILHEVFPYVLTELNTDTEKFILYLFEMGLSSVIGVI